MGKRYPIQTNVSIEKLASEGKAITYVGEKVCFVPFVAPGDVVDLQIVKKRKQFLEAKVIKYHKLGDIRREPKCEHFGVCGGCKWQHLPYDIQLAHKQQTTIDHLQRIGHLELPNVTPILPSNDEYLYRNKLEYTFSNRRWRTAEEMQDSTPVPAGHPRQRGISAPLSNDSAMGEAYPRWRGAGGWKMLSAFTFRECSTKF